MHESLKRDNIKENVDRKKIQNNKNELKDLSDVTVYLLSFLKNNSQ